MSHSVGHCYVAYPLWKCVFRIAPWTLVHLVIMEHPARFVGQRHVGSCGVVTWPDWSNDLVEYLIARTCQLEPQPCLSDSLSNHSCTVGISSPMHNTFGATVMRMSHSPTSCWTVHLQRCYGAGCEVPCCSSPWTAASMDCLEGCVMKLTLCYGNIINSLKDTLKSA